MTIIFDEQRNALSDALREMSIMEPDDIAKMLKAHGIKGVARNCGNCPIANYLNSKLTGRHFAALDRVYALDAVTDVVVETPASVRSFMKKFDAGKYLFLDEGRPIE